MFDDVLIESAGKDRRAGGWISTFLSLIVHVALIGAVIIAGYYVKKNPEVVERPMAAFIVAAPPPAPPPPPPGPSTPTASTPHVERRVESHQPVFQQPQTTPQELPPVDDTATQSTPQTPVEGGMPGGEEGGEVGGVAGGKKGGVVGGDLDGVVGGTGNAKGTQPGGTGGSEIPVRVGGNVLPPKIVTRVDPRYTEPARKGRIEGVVIIEAVIDRNGDVTEARLLKELGFGLDQQALAAIRAWKFKPGTLNGQAVPVYYNLTVRFQID